MIFLLLFCLASATPIPTEIPFCRLPGPEECIGKQRVFVERFGSENPFSDIPSNAHASIVHYDFDSDGDYDLIEGGSNFLFYLENIGTATLPKFSKSVLFEYDTLGGGHGWVTPILFDLDDDGDMDFMLLGQSEAMYPSQSKKALGLKGMRYYKNIGNITYPKFQVWDDTDGSLVYYGAIEQGWSFPLYGKNNLIANQHGSNRFDFYENIGGNPIQFIKKEDTENPLHSLRTSDQATFTFLDIDNDGDDDIVVSSNGGSLDYLENTGSPVNPSFTKKNGLSNPFSELQGLAPHAMDVNGDGYVDLVVRYDSSQQSKSLRYFENTSPSELTYEVQHADHVFVNIVFDPMPTPCAVDFDNDLNTVELIVGGSDGFIQYVHNDGKSNKFTNHNSSSFHNPLRSINVGSYSAPGAWDIDGDQDQDVIIVNGRGAVIFVENTGNITHAQFVVRDGNDNPFNSIDLGMGRYGEMSQYSPSGVDLDDDGDIDFVSATRSTGNPNVEWFRYWENIGDKFNPLFRERTGSQNPFIAVHWKTCCRRESAKQVFYDWDGDGDMDLINSGGMGYFRYYENTGNKSHPLFTEETTKHPLSHIDAGSNLAFTIVGLDGSGSPDLIVSQHPNLLRVITVNSCQLPNSCNGNGVCLRNQVTQKMTCNCVSDVASGIQCQSCAAGKIEEKFVGGSALQVAKAPSCLPCEAGSWSSVTEVLNKSCILCEKGQYNANFAATAEKSCLLCPTGFSNNVKGQAFCLPCIPGRHQSNKGALKCEDCQKDHFTNITHQTKCTKCGIGRSADNGSSRCLPCPPGEAGTPCVVCKGGQYRPAKNDDGTETDPTICLHCPIGRYQSQEGRAVCLPCIPGEYQNETNSLVCKSCDAGRYRKHEDIPTSCTACATGQSSEPGSTKCQACEAGTYSNITGGDCTNCDAGQYRTSEDIPTSCRICEAGRSSDTGSTKCQKCEAGKFSKQGGNCTDCSNNQYRPRTIDRIDTDSTFCLPCMQGLSPNKLFTDCVKPNWKIASDCGDNQYLNDTSTTNDDWTCEVCPEGGACKGDVTSTTISAISGWWMIPLNERITFEKMFAKCLYLNSCIRNESQVECNNNDGYRNNSRLCHGCIDNYRRAGSDQCARCPSNAANWGLMFLGFIMIMFGLLFIAGTAIASAGKQELSESVQKIMLNYFQVAAMARIFPLQWPEVLKGMFDFQGAISTVGDHLVNPDCVTTSVTAAELFYSKQIFFAFLPFLVIAISFIIWFLYGIYKGTPFFDKRDRNSSNETKNHEDDVQLPLQVSTPKDRFVITVGAVLYLMFPTLVAGTFKIFDCRTIGNDSYLHADMEESCNSKRYILMAGLVGVTQMILYVFGLPCLMLWFLIRNKDRLDEHVVQSRYGLFYAGYKRERFYWETVLSFRKIAIVGLGVFGPSLGPVRQSQLACLILLICILLEIGGDPFKISSPRHKILSKLERTSLLVLWLTMWAGTMIFSSAEAGDTGMVQLLTVSVALMTTGVMFCLVGQLIRECLYEKRDSAIVTNVTRMKRTFSEGVLSRTTETTEKVDETQSSDRSVPNRKNSLPTHQIDWPEGKVETFENPMDNKEKKKKIKNNPREVEMTGLAPAPAKRPKHRKNDTNVVEICVQSTTIEIDEGTTQWKKTVRKSKD